MNGQPPPTARPVPAESNLDDAAWIEQLQRGDRQAFARIYERYRVRIYSFLLRLCGRRDQAEDLLQDTFVQLARHASRLRPDTQLAPWLYTVARNRYRSQRRTAMSRLIGLRDWFLGTRADAPLTSGNPQQTAVERQQVAQLEAALQRLSPSLREVILLIGVEEFDHNAAAQVLGLQPAALRKRLERARTQLQWELSESERGRGHGDT